MMQLSKKYFSLMIILFIIAGMLGACGKEPVKVQPVKQHINYLLPGTPLSLDPGKLQDEADYQLITNLFEGLVRLKPDGTLEKAMAEDWQVTDEGRKYIFTIREANWSDGEKVTAYDFEATVKRNLDPSFNCPYAYLLYDVKNAEGYHRSMDSDYSGKTAIWENVGIKAQDEKTLVIELQQRDPAFIKKLVHPVFYPLPPKALLASSGDFFTAPALIGNGPFKFVGEEAGKKYVLAKNTAYWDAEQVKLESMDWFLPVNGQDGWTLFNEEKVDLIVNVPITEVQQGLRRGRLGSSPLLACYYYQFNVNRKPLSDQRVRQALSYALNRQEIVEKYLQGGQKPARGLIPEGMPDGLPGTDFRQVSTGKIPDGNLEQARRLLVEAGYPRGKDFPELELLVSDDVGHQYLAEKLRGEWQKNLGITVKITSLSWQELLMRMKERDFDLGLLGWIVDYADPSAFLKQYIRGSGNNDTGWNNPVYDQFIKEAFSNDNEEVRMQAFHKAEDILLEELPVLPIYEYTKVYAAKKVIKGLYFSPLGEGIDFKWTYLEN